MTRVVRWGVRVGACVSGLLAIALFTIWVLLRASLPQLDGHAQLSGALAADRAGTIERDARGVVTVTAPTWTSAAFALGFAHAQDRFFQMDLSRRLAAGELAALVGKRALEQDRKARIFGFRALSRAVLAAATDDERSSIAAYTRGVNAGLNSLRSRPWEYWLLRSQPAPWRAEDSVLVVYSMWWQLQYGDLEHERGRLAVAARLRELAADRSDSDAHSVRETLQFLYPRGTEWDAPDFPTLAAAAMAGAPHGPDLPTPELLDLRAMPVASLPVATGRRSRPDAGAVLVRALSGLTLDSRSQELPGSNNWAVAGEHTVSGSALVANDMHLALRVPPVWYQVRVRVPGEDLDLAGVTLPGVPVLVAGSNGHIAWGFTNSYGDWSDLTEVSCDPAHNRYDTDAGPRQFSLRQEKLAVHGGTDELLTVRYSPLGVLYDVDAGSHMCLLARWLASDPEATNLHLLALNRARSVAQALELAPQIGIPQQNLIIGDRDGHIGWSLIGRVPQQDGGASAPRPLQWRDAASQPQIIDPQIGRLWSANARVVDGDAERVIGNDEASTGANYALGARAAQIRDDLLALHQGATAADMLRIQLDDRAMFLARWRTLLMGILDEDALKNHPRRAELRWLAEHWNGRASVDSVGYRLVRAFHWQTEHATFAMIVSALGLQSQAIALPPQFEGALWLLVTEQPLHLLARGEASWRAFLLAQVDATIVALRASCGELQRCSWGRHNVLAIRHPLADVLGVFGHWVDMPALQMPGDQDMPRVQAPAFGASERFAVAPGHEREAYLQLSGGQSGHPMSPFYRSGFAAWASGAPQPFLPGPTQYTLLLDESSTHD